jgi:hypothetical protein
LKGREGSSVGFGWYQNDLEETAMIHVARNLAKTGFAPHLFTSLRSGVFVDFPRLPRYLNQLDNLRLERWLLMNDFPKRRFAAVLFSLALVAAPLAASAETVTVRVAGLKGGGGRLEVMLWKDAAGFPTEPEKAVA